MYAHARRQAAWLLVALLFGMGVAPAVHWLGHGLHGHWYHLDEAPDGHAHLLPAHGGPGCDLCAIHLHAAPPPAAPAVQATPLVQRLDGATAQVVAPAPIGTHTIRGPPVT